MKTLHLKPSDMTRRADLCYISDAIYAVLNEMGVQPESYTWELLVNVNEYEDSTNDKLKNS